MNMGERKKGTGTMPGNAGGKAGYGSSAKGPKPGGGGMPDAAAQHTGGRQHFQAEHGREDMPGMPGGSRSLQGE